MQMDLQCPAVPSPSTQKTSKTASTASETTPTAAGCRRSYYRVEGRLPLRLTPLVGDEIERAIFELESPPALLTPIFDTEEQGPLPERMRRLEEKLDLLLRHAGVDVPRPLGAADLRGLVFSGSGLAVEVSGSFRAGDCFRVEILLPAPAMRLVRGVAEAVADSPSISGPGCPGRLALAFRHMTEEDRDALVAHSYELQRVVLRAAQEARGRRP